MSIRILSILLCPCLELALHHAICLTICLAKVAGDCSNMPSLQLISLLFWAFNDCREYDGITRFTFSCDLPGTVGTTNPLLVVEVMLHGHTLQYRAATCISFKTVHAIVAESRTELYLVQLLQAEKSWVTTCKESMLHAANYLQTCLATPLQHKL